MASSQIEWVEQLPKFIGKTDYIKHLNGKRLKPQEAIKAICFRCSSGYDTGPGCSSQDCPLVPYNPYT